jgi:hypothetical protein
MDQDIFKIEHDIGTFIGTDNGATVHFKYSTEWKNGNLMPHEKQEEDHTVSAYTVNPKNNETFLLKTETGASKQLALKKILEYVKNSKGMSSFTVEWAKTVGGDASKKKSYFYCHDVLDVVEKFFDGKSLADYVVYSITLNPIA